MGFGGIVAGAAVGGVAAFVATKVFLKKPDVGVVAAAAAAGGLIGGALTGGSAAAASTAPILHTIDLRAGDQTLAVKVGDVVDLTPQEGATITAIDTHGSDAVAVASINPATVNVVKVGGALLAVSTSNGAAVNVKLVVS